MFSHIFAASSLADLLLNYEDLVKTIFLATKPVAKDSKSPHSAAIPSIRN